MYSEYSKLEKKYFDKNKENKLQKLLNYKDTLSFIL